MHLLHNTGKICRRPNLYPGKVPQGGSRSTGSQTATAAIKEPQLFCRSPAPVIANVETVAEHFGEHGLTLKDYLKAAIRQPPLFCQSPTTVIANVETVAEHFRGAGLTLREYLRTALKQPSIFSRSSVTIIRNVHHIINMQREGLVTFRGQKNAPPGQELRPLFAFLVRNPACLNLGADNYALRVTYARVTGDRPRGAALLSRPRHRIERDLALAQSACPPPTSRP